MRASTSPLVAVLEGGPGRGHRGGGVGHVVGDDLVGVDPAAPADGGAGLVDQFLGQVDRPAAPASAAVSGVVIGARPYWLPRAALPCSRPRPRVRRVGAQARRPITVTSGGRTTGSSPGSTPVSDSR